MGGVKQLARNKAPFTLLCNTDALLINPIIFFHNSMQRNAPQVKVNAVL